MRVLKILHETMADGPGLRDAVYFAGCVHQCKGCHNPESWDVNGGIEISIDELVEELKSNPHTDITLTGGDPLIQSDIVELCRRLKEDTGKNIWLWTGYTMSYILRNTHLRGITRWVDVIVDGPYMDGLPSAKWCGSSNQRIYNVSGTGLKDADSLDANHIDYLTYEIEENINAFKLE